MTFGGTPPGEGGAKYFLLHVKCAVVARDLGQKPGDIVLIKEE